MKTANYERDLIPGLGVGDKQIGHGEWDRG